MLEPTASPGARPLGDADRERRGGAGEAPPIEGLLRPPAGIASMPAYDAGWLTEQSQRRPFLSYLGQDEMAAVNWSESLEDLHDRVSEHFMDVSTRRAMVVRLGPLPQRAAVLDVGCSTGFLLVDIRRVAPEATLLGLDPIASGLVKAHAALPEAPLLQADVCELPLLDESVDVVVSANVLEHVADDERALTEIARVLKPGGRAVIVIPRGPSSYNYFDSVLGHERRYARGELARKGQNAGLRVLEDMGLGGLLYPAYWLVKRYNQRRYGRLPRQELERRVARDIEDTSSSSVGELACRAEAWLIDRGTRLPFGIRGLTVFERP
jgi:SAM-dependent methyltransferase